MTEKVAQAGFVQALRAEGSGRTLLLSSATEWEGVEKTLLGGAAVGQEAANTNWNMGNSS